MFKLILSLSIKFMPPLSLCSPHIKYLSSAWSCTLKKKSMYLFMVVLSLACCSWLCSCGEWGVLFPAVLPRSADSRHVGPSSSSMWAQPSGLAGSAAPLRGESSQTSGQSRVTCCGGQVLIRYPASGVRSCVLLILLVSAKMSRGI